MFKKSVACILILAMLGPTACSRDEGPSAIHKSATGSGESSSGGGSADTSKDSAIEGFTSDGTAYIIDESGNKVAVKPGDAVSGGTVQVNSDGTITIVPENKSSSAKPAASSAAASAAEKPPNFTAKELIYNVGMCVTENYSPRDTAASVKKRTDLYKEFGLKTVRVATLWGSIEPLKEGTVMRPSDYNYLTWLKNNGMRFKVIVGAVSSIPNWYLQKYPDAVLLGNDGRPTANGGDGTNLVKSINSVTYLMPGLREQLDRSVENIMKFYVETGLINAVDSIVIDMGPAGEALYPPGWTQVPNGLYGAPTVERFWCYDKYMQADFRRAMKEKYGTIAAANAAWGKNKAGVQAKYTSFDALTVPLPNTHAGTMWNDVLTWYRQLKRNFIEENLKSYKRIVDKYSGGRIKLIVYLPGNEEGLDTKWQNSVNSGGAYGTSDIMVKVMADSRFIMDKAVQKGCYVQYTGAENDSEVKFLKKYMADRGYNVPLFGENAGGYDMGEHMDVVVDVIINNGLQGIDITHDQWIHTNNAANQHYNGIKSNLKRLEAYLLK